jgi:hypothetical protein
MGITKRIIVLANSIKHYPCTCIAGREIKSNGPICKLGPWIRPVSIHDEGGISPSEARLQSGRQPAVMDFVELDLTRKVNDSSQPENWLIDRNTKWRSVNRQYAGKPRLDSLVETPEHLWYQRNERTDRISSAVLRRHPPAQSLYLIRVPGLKISFGWQQWQGEYKAKRRASFRYNMTDYDIAITDPAFLERFRTQFPRKGDPTKSFEVQSAHGCYLCVSLAPEFNGYHYKSP